MNKGIQLGVESSNSKNSNRFDSFLKNTKKFIAFTLAETLIVMGIIGVVAALTIPNLNSSTNNMEKVTKVKKIYAQLNEAQNRATAVYGPLINWCTGLTGEECSAKYMDRITEFLKVTKTCDETNYSTQNSCFYFVDPLGTTDISMDTAASKSKFYLADGAVVSVGLISPRSANEKMVQGAAFGQIKDVFQYFEDIYGYAGMLLVDIDGPNKGKNSAGNDVFGFYVSSQGIVPCYAANVGNSPGCLGGGLDYGFEFCTGWVIQYSNMDYLKCPNDLAWGTKTSCK
ncbi:MAG: type II secretion system protein [Candidatus Gastranaerophilaceae bacterium]